MKGSGETKDISFISLRPLAELAMRESGAEGFVMYAIDSATGACLPQWSSGLMPSNDGCGKAQTLSFPLRANGDAVARLAFRFGASIPPAAEIALGKVVMGIERLWALLGRKESYSTLAGRIGQLEIELIDSKIADRVNGLLDSTSTETDSIGAVMRHIDTVLLSQHSLRALETLRKDLEDELANREVTGRAKAFLQSQGMSEHEAHHHLRALSRQSRKPLRAVAQEFLEAAQ